MCHRFADSFLWGRSWLHRSRLSKEGNCMLMLSELYFKTLCSQRDFFQVESIQSDHCRCNARRLLLLCLLERYHSIDHTSRIHRDCFEGRIEHWLSSVLKDFFMISRTRLDWFNTSICNRLQLNFAFFFYISNPVRVRVDTNYLSKEVVEEIETGHSCVYLRLFVSCFFLVKFWHRYSTQRDVGQNRIF